MDKQHVIQYFGSISALAKALGIKAPSIYDWRDGPIPELRARQLAEKYPDLKFDPADYERRDEHA